MYFRYFGGMAVVLCRNDRNFTAAQDKVVQCLFYFSRQCLILARAVPPQPPTMTYS